MTTVKKNTSLYNAIKSDYMHRGLGSIFEAYAKPSSKKVKSYLDIENRAKMTAGYNNDLRVVGASSHFYSTIYSYVVDGATYVVKDTASNTYIIEL